MQLVKGRGFNSHSVQANSCSFFFLALRLGWSDLREMAKLIFSKIRSLHMTDGMREERNSYFERLQVLL
jgi:hypothetical protein